MTYIFDLDGTLALTGHRNHLIEGPRPDWDAFYAACVNDQPNDPVIRTLQELTACRGVTVRIWTGRSAGVRTETVAWLGRHRIYYDELRMRSLRDRRADTDLKREWLLGLDSAARIGIVAAFEDRERVVQMWRDNGVACFQVAPGKF
jgi:hypothetical protein